MADDKVRALLLHHWEASDANDFTAESRIYATGAVLEYPQSGERIRGAAAIQASRMAQPARKRFKVRRLVGCGALWVSEVVITYDAEPVHVVSIMEFENDEVARETQYFGEPFAPAPSRVHMA